MLVCARAVSARAIRPAKDACAGATEAKVARNVQTASMIASKSRGNTRICCGGSGAVEVTGSVGRGVAGIGTGEGESGTGGGAPSVGMAWEGCSTAVCSSARSSSTSAGGWRWK